MAPRFIKGFMNKKLRREMLLLHFFLDVTDFLKELIGTVSDKIKKFSTEIQ